MPKFFDQPVNAFPNKIDDFLVALQTMDKPAQSLVNRSKIRPNALNDKFFLSGIKLDWEKIYKTCVELLCIL